MCRLFGFKSGVALSVHHSLHAAENAIAKQSNRHPDGWGIGYYFDEIPHLMRRAGAAFEDHTYRQLTQFLASQMVIAHVRKATVGGNSELNTHPFQCGAWLFSHNGTISEFSNIKDLFLKGIASPLRPRILGETDSEHCFYLFLSQLMQGRKKIPRKIKICEGMNAIRSMIHQIDAWTDSFSPDKPSQLNFLATNGEIFVGSRRGIELYFSTKKHNCSIKSQCPHFSPHCLGPLEKGGVNTHILISSEPISSEDIWEEIPDHSVFAVDKNINFLIEPIYPSMYTQPGACAHRA